MSVVIMSYRTTQPLSPGLHSLTRIKYVFGSFPLTKVYAVTISTWSGTAANLLVPVREAFLADGEDVALAAFPDHAAALLDEL